MSATPPQTKRFLGKTFDPELGMSELGVRMLANDLGRFLTPDPVRAVDPVSSQERTVMTHNPQRLQLYGYGLNNPYRYVDPDGEIVVVPLLLAAWAVAEVALAAYDAYDTVRTIASSETSTQEKVIAGGQFLAGAILPGGGYSQIDDAAKAVKRAVAKGTKGLKEQAADLVPLNNGKHRVTLRSEKQQLEIDLSGKDHTGIPTPHTKVSPRNTQAPEHLQPAYNTSNKYSTTRASTQEEIRAARKYLER